MQKICADSAKSWSVDATSIDVTTFDLATKNPADRAEMIHRSPEEIIDDIVSLDAESAQLMQTIRGLL
jgi:type I restriction enzyme M protein